jgi:hypothetical protein
MDYLANSVSLIAGSGLDLLAKSRKKELSSLSPNRRSHATA